MPFHNEDSSILYNFAIVTVDLEYISIEEINLLEIMENTSINIINRCLDSENENLKMLTCENEIVCAQIQSLNKNLLKSSSDDGFVINNNEETVLKYNMRNPSCENNQRSFLDLMTSSKTFDYEKILHLHKIPNPKLSKWIEETTLIIFVRSYLNWRKNRCTC